MVNDKTILFKIRRNNGNVVTDLRMFNLSLPEKKINLEIINTIRF